MRGSVEVLFNLCWEFVLEVGREHLSLRDLVTSFVLL